MFNYYNLEVLPIILNRFNVDNIIISGYLTKNTLKHVLKYCEDRNISYNLLDSKEDTMLNILPNLTNYSAIFLNDDANWYTIYNELKIIKETSKEFPLVFICNNKFPNKRRDSYSNPKLIPEEFRQEYSEYIIYHDITLNDGFFHAIESGTSKNGVLTAIEDFLKDNISVGIMGIKLDNEITILYAKNSISQIRLGMLSEEIEGYEVKQDDLIENKVTSNYISNFGIFEDTKNIEKIKEKLIENEKIIEDYENKIKLHNNEMKYKNSQIANFDSKLSLKNSKIKNFESKLLNQENKIHELNIEINSLKNNAVNNENNFKNKEKEFDNKIQNANSQINSLKRNISLTEQKEKKLTKQLQGVNNQIKTTINQFNEEINYKNNQIKIKNNAINEKQHELHEKQHKLNEKQHELKFIREYNINQLSKLENKEYCISCYKEEITNNKLEIKYLKDNSFKKKLLNPLSYIYLFIKSNPKELSLNLKLYKTIKNSKCFDIGYYLNNNSDLQGSSWCKYFSPELHYVCKGFDENRRFNKKYFNTASKKELLEYIIKCS